MGNASSLERVYGHTLPDSSAAGPAPSAARPVDKQVLAPRQVSRLFISFASPDGALIDTLEPLLDAKGIRFWRDKHHMKAGRIEKQIDRALRFNHIVLLVISQHSIHSDWVEWEVARARELEREAEKAGEPRDILCPISLDPSWKDARWPGLLRQQIEDYHILDCSGWENPVTLDAQFGKLVEGLGIFYEGR